MSSKTQESYERVLNAIVQQGDNMGLDMNPETTMTDFEQDILNAVECVFGPEVSTKSCFYHLTQSTWRKVQNLGLDTKYKEDYIYTRQFCVMIDSLAFFPVNMVEKGMAFLRSKCFEHLEELLNYFDTTYVTDRQRHSRNVPPLYPPSV